MPLNFPVDPYGIEVLICVGQQIVWMPVTHL